MARLKRNDLVELTEIVKAYTGIEYTVRMWNGYYHIHTKENGYKVTSGTIRECYNYLQAYIDGLSYIHNKR